MLYKICMMLRVISSYTYYLATCIAGLLVFSCTGPPSIPSPVQSSIPYFRFATEETTIGTGTHKIRIRANEILKYSKRVRFVVSGTAFAPRDYAFVTKPFVLHTPNYPNHHVKNIIEMSAGTNQIDISLTVKKQLRCEIKTIQLSIENLDGNMETLQLSLKHIPPPCVITIAGDGTSGSNNGLGTLTQFHQPRGIVTNRLGEIYVSDGNHIIRKIKSDGVTTTFVGTLDAIAFSNHGTGSFSEPTGLVFDTSNNLYVADWDNHLIRKITSMGIVSTLTGGGTTGTPCPGTTGTTVTCRDGIGSSARFNYPTGVAVDSAGFVYVADSENHRIRKITPGGMVSTLAGTGSSGFMNGAGDIAKFNFPYGVAVDGSDNVYVTDKNNHRIRKIIPGGMVSTLAGTGSNGFIDGAGDIAKFNSPTGVAVDGSGFVYVADTINHRIRQITPGGVVSTLAGGGTRGTLCPGTTGITVTCRDGTGSSARFNYPHGIAVDSAGVIYVADYGNNRIRKITTEIPTINPICTNGTPSNIKLFTANTEKCTSCNSGFNLNGDICGEQFDPICTNGTPSNIKLFTANTEKCVSCDSGFGLDGELCREELDPICTNGTPSNIKLFTANTEKCVSCDSGFGLDGERCRQQFDSICTNGVISTAKFFTANIEKCVSCDSYYTLKNDETCAEIMVSTLAGTFSIGFMDGAGTVAKFNEPIGVAVDGSGNVYVADYSNHRIRKVTSTGMVSTFAGTATSGFMDDTNGMAGSAQFNKPSGVAVDSVGNVYVADYNNHRIRRITTNSMGVVEVSTLAGTGTSGFMDDVGNVAKFNSPSGIAVGSAGVVYVADYNNHRIRKITTNSMGVVEVSTLAGTGIKADGTAGGGFMDGTGSSAQFNKPYGVAVDSVGNVYVTDSQNHRIRKIKITMDAMNNEVIMVSTLAGTGIKADGTAGGGFMNGTGSLARFSSPHGVAVDSADNVYVADRRNYRIRKIKITMDAMNNEVITVSTLAGTGITTFQGVMTEGGGFSNGAGNIAQFDNPIGVAVDNAGVMYVADQDNHRIRKITIPQ